MLEDSTNDPDQGLLKMDELQIKTDTEEQVLKLWYEPKTSRSIYDICDTNGTVLKSGELEANGARIDISDLERSEYLLMVLDGEEILKRRVNLENGQETG